MTYYYTNPTSMDAYTRAVMAQDELWVTNSNLQGLINALRIVNFAARDSRQTGLEAINSLVPAQPYRITGNISAELADIRFGFTSNGSSTPVPPPVLAKMYVCLDRDGWLNTIMQCKSALEYNDRNNEKTMLTNGSGNEQTESINAPDPEIVRSQFNDASQAFRRGFQALIGLARQRVGVYNTVSFEADFGLVWALTFQQPVEE